MNILITGAGGYVGCNLAAHLSGQGHSITALVRKTTPQLQAISGVKIIEAPKYHLPEWNGAFAFQNQDMVIHAAGRVHYPNESGAEVSDCYRHDNFLLTANLGKMAQNAGVKRFLFISSVGAKLLEDQFHEGRMTQKDAWLQHPYRMSKLEAERALLAMKGSMKAASVRLPMVYGTNAPGSFSTLTRFIKLRIPLPFESFTKPRAFISIDTVKDFVSYYVQHGEADGKCWSIRDTDEVSPLSFASGIANAARLPEPRFWSCEPWLLNFMATLVRKQQTARSLSEPVNIDLQPVRAKLGWEPRLSVAEGLKRAFG